MHADHIIGLVFSQEYKNLVNKKIYRLNTNYSHDQIVDN